MSKKYATNTVIAFFALLMFFSCSLFTEPEEEEAPPDSSTQRKPNIYIYPEEDAELTIKIDFPNGGRVTVSDPDYNQGWDISVSSAGVIDDKYTFLFYECKTPNLCQYDEGWVVDREALSSFFESNLHELNFRDHELTDFLDYWIPRLNTSDKYIIYPQYSDILEEMSRIKCTPSPLNINRICYVIRKFSSELSRPKEPATRMFDRAGFHIMEWGVIWE